MGTAKNVKVNATYENRVQGRDYFFTFLFTTAPAGLHFLDTSLPNLTHYKQNLQLVSYCCILPPLVANRSSCQQPKQHRSAFVSDWIITIRKTKSNVLFSHQERMNLPAAN